MKRECEEGESNPVKRAANDGDASFAAPGHTEHAFSGGASGVGSATGVALRPINVERFWRRVDRRGPDECWLWRGTMALGYGTVTRYRADGTRTSRGVHRIAWELSNRREVPNGFEIMHSCDEPRCCNPSHLSIGTHAENMRDRERKGRRPHAERIGAPIRLTADGVREIRLRRAAGESYESLAIAFGVTPMSIQNCVVRRTWRHVA